MEKQKNTFSFIIYLVGLIAGLTITLIATWGDLEAAFYGFDRTGGLRLSSMSCPILMSNTETSSFSIKVNNSAERALSPTVKVDISSFIAPITSYENIFLEVGETKKLSWELGPKNIDLGRFIFARAWVYASYPMPDREATCGILTLPLPLHGNIVVGILTLLCLLGMGFGLYMQKQAEGQNGSGMKAQRFVLLAVIVVVGLISAYIGNWLLGVLMIALALLVGVISIMHSVKI